jgi:HlyD family secretion protein
VRSGKKVNRMLARSPEIAELLKTNVAPNWWTRHRGLLVIGSVASILVVTGALWWWFESKSASATQYQTVAAKTGTIVATVSTTGTVEPITQVEVGSEISGTVKTVNVSYNDHVTVGEILAEISTDQLSDQTNRTRSLLDSAKATVLDKQAALSQATKDLTRTLPLAHHDVVSQQDLETDQTALLRAQAALAGAQAQVEVAQADLSSNQTQLEKATIRSPIDGIVLDRTIDPGQTVAASLQSPVLFTIANDMSQMNLLVDVDEADAGTVKEGQRATFTVSAYPDRSFAAKVMQLRDAPITVSGVVSYKSVLSVDNSSLLLRPGMTAAADIVTHEVANALLIPNAALRYAPVSKPVPISGGSPFTRLAVQQIVQAPSAKEIPANQKLIWVLRDGAAVQLAVTVGITDGSWTQVVKADLADGEAVIIDSEVAK